MGGPLLMWASAQHLVPRDLAELHEVLHDLAAAELRLAELAVAEHVRDLHGFLVARPCHDLEPDLEADRVERHAVERRPPYREEAGGAVTDRDEHVPEETRGARDDAPPQRPVFRATAGDIAAADREIRPLLDRERESRHRFRWMREVRIHHDQDIAARLRETREHR